MFTDTQVAALSAPLNRANVDKRTQSGRSLSYIEGWHAIAEANRIFGFDRWCRETIELRQTSEPYKAGDNWRVGYLARVRIRVYGGEDFGLTVARDGTGYGSGIGKDLNDAHESAAKEAETDAMKRALMTFGNPFGLALYDKTQANVEPAPREVPNNTNPSAGDPGGSDDLAKKWSAWAKTEAAKIGQGEFDREAMATWDASNRKYFTRCENNAPGEFEILMTTVEMRLAALDALSAAA